MERNLFSLGGSGSISGSGSIYVSGSGSSPMRSGSGS
jgi:hypothetical protein